MPACLPARLSVPAEREPQPADEGGQLQLQLLDADKSEPQPLGLESSFQEYLRWVWWGSRGALLVVVVQRRGGQGGEGGVMQSPVASTCLPGPALLHEKAVQKHTQLACTRGIAGQLLLQVSRCGAG